MKYTKILAQLPIRFYQLLKQPITIVSPCLIFLAIVTIWNYLVYWFLDLLNIIFPPLQKWTGAVFCLIFYCVLNTWKMLGTQEFFNIYLLRIEWDIMELNSRKQKICTERFFLIIRRVSRISFFFTLKKKVLVTNPVL